MRSGLIATVLAGSSIAAAQSAPPPSQGDTLAPVVVTAERTRTSLATASSAVTRISASELARLPHATVADVLRLVPGFALVDFDGLGFDPQVMVRGFYGGGEAEYVVVLVDGKPAAQVSTGLVAWDVLPPLASIEAIEVVRGSASALYGDAAVGGVINILTRPPVGSAPTRWSVGAGAYGARRASVNLASATYALAGGFDRSAGFRRHGERRAARASASMTVASGASGSLSVSARSHWRSFDEPGALLESLAADREASDALFRFDHTSDRDHVLMLDGERRVADGIRLSGTLGIERRRANALRTLALAPGFGDTQERELSTGRLAGGAKVEIIDTPVPGSDLLVLGADVERGSLDSRYYAVMSGGRDAYLGASGTRGALQSAGEGRRQSVAGFVTYAHEPTEAVRFSLGARIDALHDVFEPNAPSTGERVTATHTVISPRAGVNVRYWSNGSSAGHVFLTASRSFKAPTLDQLFDQRAVPVPFPPFSATTSNADLEPQFGVNVEAGVSHAIWLGRLRAAGTLSVFQIDMKDELDFDVSALRYVNIGRSRHRGVEVGLHVTGRSLSWFANYSRQSASARSGDFAGQQLKAIPRHLLTGGVSFTPLPGLHTALTLTRAHRMYLDDANARTIPAWTRMDAQVSWALRDVTLVLEARNALNAAYHSTGFIDPAGTGEAYYYPAAGRQLRLAVRRGW